jgi:ABC-type branched-subunit amino acid transport system substrate-binding protein
VAGSHPDGVVVAGYANSGGVRMIKALRARLGPRVKLMVGEEFGYVADILAGAGSAARGVYITSSEVLADAPTMTPAGEHFVATFGEAARGGYALHAAQAAEVVLQAIAESDGTRASVLQALHSLRVEKGILGTFAFDRNGDMTPATVTIARITGVTTPDVRLPLALQGAVVDRVLPVPDSLSR